MYEREQKTKLKVGRNSQIKNSKHILNALASSSPVRSIIFDVKKYTVE